MTVRASNVVIGTCTMYSDITSVRYQLALRFLEEAQRAGYWVIVVDRSKEPSIRDNFRALGATVWEFDDSCAPYGEQQRLLFQILGGIARIKDLIAVYTQPEKVTLTNFLPALTGPVANNEAALVVGARTPTGLASYPPYMIELELEANRVYAECTGLIGFDPTFSVYAFSATAAYYFANCKPAEYRIPDMWIDLFATILALRAGVKLKSVAVDFRYPPEQLEDELRAGNAAIRQKRIAQRDAFIAGFGAFSTAR